MDGSSLCCLFMIMALAGVLIKMCQPRLNISHDHKLDSDSKRTKILEQYGYRVIRYSNEEIYENLEALMEFGSTVGFNIEILKILESIIDKNQL